MFWIINTNLKREGGYDALIAALERQGIGYVLVRKPPFTDYLVAMHDDLDEQGNNKPVMLDHIEGPVFVTGTTSMNGVSAAHGWQPGYISAEPVSACIEHWGEHCLNADAVFGEIATIVAPPGEFFIRPDADSKAFAGTVMSTDNFEEWRRQITDIKGWTTCPPDTRVLIAPLHEIWAEYRCCVVDGRVVTASRYKTGNTVAYSSDVGPMVLDFAKARVAEWNPRIAFILDVAHTPDGMKVIETNAISSSGFYAMDMNIFVGEISALETRYDGTST